MGSLQLQLRIRRREISKLIYSTGFEPLPFSRSSQFSPVSLLLKNSRHFGTDSMDDDFSNGRRRRLRDEQAADSASTDERFPFSNPNSQNNLNRPQRGYTSSLNHYSNREPRSHEPFELDDGESPLQFLNRNSNPQPRKDNPSQSDYSFLEKFKLGSEKNNKSSVNRENPQNVPDPQLGSSNQPSESQKPPEDADQIFKKMKETGLIPNAVAMLDGLCKDGLVKEAMNLFGLMREKGTIPEVVIYTAVVDGFCKAQKLDDAIRIFRKMQNNGIIPNAFSYTVLIQGLYNCKRSEDAIGFCIEMLEAGHTPNVKTFVGLVDGLCNEKGVEEAKNAIATLKQKGFFINEKGVREFLDKNAAFAPLIWEAIFGKKLSQRPF